MAEYPRPFGDYVLLQQLGIGGMSQIDLARKAVEDAEYVRFLVIKRVKADKTDDETFVRMFKDEARITAELHHNNIAQVYDFGRYGDEYYLALEYVPGVDLRRVINTLREKKKTIPLRIGLRILCDVLDGLGYAHERADTAGQNMHIVHRDVNPRNVMISTRGEIKVIDFGVAKATNRLERTRTDHIKGKFAYMAPEQIQAGEIDHRADLFAVGLMLHEIITGYSPFYKLTQVQIVHRLFSGHMPRLPTVDPDSDSLLTSVHSKSLNLDPAKRYQTARAFKIDLEKIAAPIGGLASHASVAALLAEIDPGLTLRIHEMVTTYSGAIPQKDLATVPLPALRQLQLLEEFEDSEASMSGPALTTPAPPPPPDVKTTVGPVPAPSTPGKPKAAPAAAARSSPLTAASIDPGTPGPAPQREPRRRRAMGVVVGLFVVTLLLLGVVSGVGGGLYATGRLDGLLSEHPPTMHDLGVRPSPEPPEVVLAPVPVAEPAPVPQLEPEPLDPADRVADTGDAPTADSAAAVVDPEPVAAAEPAPELAAAPPPPAPASSLPRPDPVPTPAPTTSRTPTPAVSASPAPTISVVPAPAPRATEAPRILVVPKVQPAPEAAPAPTGPVPVGVVTVASEVRGRPILIDGRETQHTTPAEIQLAVGAHVISVDGSEQRVEVAEDKRKVLFFK